MKNIINPVTGKPFESQEEFESVLRAMAGASAKKITLKVSEKGAVSAYGLGRFPVTLYAEQWDKLLAEAEAIKAFIQANKGSLTTKADKQIEKLKQA